MDNVKVMNDELRNIRYMKDIKDELHQTNIFLGHLCKVMDALVADIPGEFAPYEKREK